MAVVVNILKTFIALEFGKKILELDHEVDCIVEDFRKGKDPGLNVKIIYKKLDEAEKKREEAIKIRDDAIRIYDALVLAKAIYDATDKSTSIGAALNPAAAAIGYATRFIIDGVKKEISDLANVIEVVPTLAKNFGSFLKRSKKKIALAAAAYAAKAIARKDRRNMVG